MIYYQYLIRPRDVTAQKFVSLVNEQIQSAGLGLFFKGYSTRDDMLALTEVVSKLIEYPANLRENVEIILTEGEFDHE